MAYCLIFNLEPGNISDVRRPERYDDAMSDAVIDEGIYSAVFRLASAARNTEEEERPPPGMYT